MLPPPASTSTTTNSIKNGPPYSRKWPNSSDPSVSKVKPEVYSSSIAKGSSSSHSSNYINKTDGITAEASSSSTMPGAFGDDSSTASDSDIEIIGSEDFRDNGRHVSTPLGSRISSSGNLYGAQQSRMQRPSFSSEAQTAREATLRQDVQGSTRDALHTALYNSKDMPKWMSTRPLPNSSQNLALPGSYPRPNIGLQHNQSYGNPHGYGSNEEFVGNKGNLLFSFRWLVLCTMPYLVENIH